MRYSRFPLQLDLLPAVALLLGQTLVAPLVEALDDLQTLGLPDPSPGGEEVVLPEGAAAPKLVVVLSEVDLADACGVEGEGAHDAGLDSHDEDAAGDLPRTHRLLHLVQAVHLAVSRGVLVQIGQVVTARHPRESPPRPAHEHAPHRHLVPAHRLPPQLQRLPHPRRHLLLRHLPLLLRVVHNYILLQMEGKTLNLKHYVSVVTQLVFRAAAIAKECAENPDLKKYEKAVNDPVTEADFKIQTMLCTGLRHFFPGLLIVGEETTEYKGHIELDLNAITLHHHPSHVELSENIPIEEFVVWIDPIDNTRGFIRGTLDAVTILVGLSRKERAYLGVVGLPYQKIDKELVYEPEVLVGTVEGKKAFTISASQEWAELEAPPKNAPLRFLISDSRGLNPAVESLVKKYGAELHRIGGSGKKIAEVIFGHMDALLYLSAANHKWDSCAGEAIILALGGYFTDCFNQPIAYDPKASTVNKRGNICGFGEEFYSQLIADVQAASPNL